ncbi:hypothetical protein BD560DRAFT_468938 [Blakeslea trispora]|nr:hypothetical protein BD560DRAFT_468938 [Blakeslea trispora]
MESLRVAFHSMFSVSSGCKTTISVSDENFTFVKGRMRLPVTASMKFHHLDSLTDTNLDMTRKEHIILVRSKFEDQKRLLLTCKFSSCLHTDKPRTDAKRQTQTCKGSCRPNSDDEHTHDHPCTAKYNWITPEGKSRLLGPADIKAVSQMVQKNTSVPEIRKNIAAFEGAPVLEYQDIANLSNEIKNSAIPNSKIERMPIS